MKIGIIGNTVLTYKAVLYFLQQECEVKYVFGMPPHMLRNKVNACDLSKLCSDNKIAYIDNNEWESISHKKVDVVYELGDSRIVPSSFLQENTVVGNHGAVLPFVQGAASLVWGRMLNSGTWGVSLMELNEKIDNGDILITKEIVYDKNNTTMKEFVKLCDDATIDIVKSHFKGQCKKTNNEGWAVKVAKNTDSKKVVDMLEISLEKGMNIYLPPRRPNDAKISSSWDPSFLEVFKKANDLPYPKYYEGAPTHGCIT